MRLSPIIKACKNTIKIKDITNDKYKFISYSHFYIDNINNEDRKKYRNQQIRNFLLYTRKKRNTNIENNSN